MEIDCRRGGMLGLFWLLTAGCAFLLGREGEPGADADRSGIGSLTRSAQGALPAGEAPVQKAQQQRRSDRKVNNVARFISFTRLLSNEELDRLLPEVTEKMTLKEVREALLRLDKLRPGPARRLATLELLNRFAQLDPGAALAHAEGEDDPGLRNEMVYHAIKGWSSVNPAAAHAHATSTKGIDPKTLRAVWEGIAKTNDLEKTLAFITELGPGSNAYSEPYEIWDIYMTLHDLYRKDDQAVVAWVEQLPPGETRNRAFHSIVDQLARHDPVAAKEWIEEQADPSNITEAYVELAESWARHNPEAAVEWAANLPPTTNDLRRIYERLFTRFIQYDFLDAANYLVEQDPSPALDTAFEVYIDKVKTIDPASTIEWAASITDHDRRWTALQEVASVWRGQDAEALTAYVDEMNLSEAERNTLLGK